MTGLPVSRGLVQPVPRSTTWTSYVTVAVGAELAIAVGLLVESAPTISLLAAGATIVALLVWTRPEDAAYLTVGITPLVVGIDRGALIPLLRPNEALVGLLAAVLVAHAGIVYRRSGFIATRLQRIELALIALAITNSVIPAAWLTVRGVALTADDVTYALVIWKYLVVYGVIRYTVRTNEHVGRCIQIILASSLVVGLIAIFQALDLFGVRAMLVPLYAPLGHEGALDLPRAGSTLSLPAAAGDLLIITGCLASAMWFLQRRHGVWYGIVVTVCVLGTFSAAEFSSALGLVVGAICVAALTNRKEILLYALAAIVVAVIVMWPIVQVRLLGFQSPSGFPESWIGRWHNLQSYFWPELFSGSGWNIVFGVRPAARIPVSTQATGFVWIESGYTWLLWGGGVPMVLAFIYFVKSALQLTWSRARALADTVGVAAIGAFSGVVVVTTLMVFDPHLTYRGAADCLLSLLAICAAATATADHRTASRVGAERQQDPVEVPAMAAVGVS
jgi:hypothetical protein